MKIYGDDYITIVAETKKQAEDFYKNELEFELEASLLEVSGAKRCMWFDLDGLPAKYYDEIKYPRRALKDDKGMYYTAVKITLSEAMNFRKDKPPYCLSISADLL